MTQIEISDEVVPKGFIGAKRKATLQKLSVDSNGDIQAIINIDFFENDGGKYGRPLIEAINKDDSYSDQERQMMIKKYHTSTTTISTRGLRIDPATKAVVKGDAGIELLHYIESSIKGKSFSSMVEAITKLFCSLLEKNPTVS